MGERREFEFEGAAAATEVADTLCRIADGIRARALWLSMGEATEKKSKAKIEIAIAWRHRSPDKGEN